MALYTFILEYTGETYMAQVQAASPKAAMKKWGQTLDISQIYGLNENHKGTLMQEIDSGKLILLGGMRNVWCTSAVVNGELALLHIVKTDTV